ncbi:Cysteine-rich secretory protein family [Popillia japonica]|uniref:Cysteine-rich secretory protein family n=1 Tax=Popillia japonica TaxID=7064 RepID=A0AAW1IDG6_POPJA
MVISIQGGIGLIQTKQSCEDQGLEVYERFGNNPNDIRTIVDRHNFYRQAVVDGKVPGQPSGIDLKYLRWDDKLAEIAQDVADTCNLRSKSLRDGRFPIGRNIARNWKIQFVPNDANWTAVIEAWFNQYKHYNFNKQRPGPPAAAGSYTQIVWANTEFIGCGFNAHDNPDEDSQYAIHQIYVCLYGPGGNQVGKYPYTKASRNAEREIIDYD